MGPSEVILHVGLHKSASTSIQHAWLDRYWWVRDGVWYPPPSAFGPGHASVAWWATDRRDFAAVVHTPVEAILNEAGSKEVDRVLLSSEEFDGLEPDQLVRLRDAFSGLRVTVVIVVARPRARFISAWQERLKQGSSGTQSELFTGCCRLARLEPGWATEMVGALDPNAVIVRLIDPQRTDVMLPEQLLRRAGVDVPLTEPASGPRRAANVGLDRVSAGLLAHLNAAESPSAQGVRRALLSQLLLSDDWRQEQGDPTEIDPEVFPRLHTLAVAEAEELRELGRSWDLWDPDGLMDAWESPLPMDAFDASGGSSGD